MVWAIRQSGLVQTFPPASGTFGSATLPGSLLVGYLSVNESNSANLSGVSVSDAINGNWLSLGPRLDGNFLVTWIFYKENAAVLQNTDAISFTLVDINGPGADFMFAEVTGIASSYSPDPYPPSTSFAIGATNAGTVTNSNAANTADYDGDLYLVSFVSTSAETWVTPRGWTLLQQSGTITGSGLASAYYYLSITSQSASAVSVTQTATPSTSIDSLLSAWRVSGNVVRHGGFRNG